LQTKARNDINLNYHDIMNETESWAERFSGRWTSHVSSSSVPVSRHGKRAATHFYSVFSTKASRISIFFRNFANQSEGLELRVESLELRDFSWELGVES